MLLVVLSILDTIAGAAIYSSAIFDSLTKIIRTLAIIMLFKGIYSITASFSSGYFFEWPGFLDVVAGIALFLLSYDLISVSSILGGVVMGKGAYYLTRSIIGV